MNTYLIKKTTAQFAEDINWKQTDIMWLTANCGDGSALYKTKCCLAYNDKGIFYRFEVEDDKINCVVTKDLSRLGRNYILTGQYTEIYFPSKGVRYIAVNDNVDTLNGENELAPFLIF